VPAGQVPDELVELFRRVEANAVLYRTMFGPGGTARVVDRLRERLAEAVAEQLPASGAESRAAAPLMDVNAHYLAGAFIGVITHWLRDDQERAPAEDMARAVWRLLRGPAG